MSFCNPRSSVVIYRNDIVDKAINKYVYGVDLAKIDDFLSSVGDTPL